MKILLVPSLVDEGWTSSDLYARNLYRNLGKALKKKTSISIMILDFFSSKKPADSVFQKISKVLKKLIFLPLFIMFSKGDVIHILDHSYAYLIFFAWGFKKKIITCHSPVFHVLENQAEEKNFQLFAGLHMVFYKFSVSLLKKANYLICVSPFIKKNLKRINATKTVIFMPISDVFFDDIPKKTLNKFKLKYNLHSDKNYFIHVGRNWIGNKNIELILKYIKENKKLLISSNSCFLKVGDQFLSEQKKYINKNKLERFIVHIGKLNQDELVAAYKSSFCLVFPSFYEGFPAPPLEAMVLNTAVITSNINALKLSTFNKAEYINPNSVEELKEKLSLCLQRVKVKNKAAVLSKVQRRVITWKHVAKHTLSVYKFIA